MWHKQSETAPEDDERASGVQQAHEKNTKNHYTYSRKTNCSVLRGYGMSAGHSASLERYTTGNQFLAETLGQTQVAEDVKNKAKEIVSGYEAQEKI